jgi:hypothetical protein
MQSFAHLVDTATYTLQPVLILIALSGWVIALVGQISATRSRKPWAARPISRMFVAGCIIFAGIIGSEFALAAYVKSAALNEIHPRLVADIELVTANDKQVDKPNNLIAALRSMHDTTAHHSHPIKGYRLFLKTSRGPLILQVCRDSDDPHEYWVFYPNFHSTTSNDVGHIFTDALDNL